MKSKNNKWIYLLMVAAALFWAGAFIAGKISIKEFSPVSVTFLRFFFASIVIFTLLVYKQKDSWKPKKEDLPIIFMLGLVGMVGYHILFFTALKYTKAINASILAATNPLMTVLIAGLIGQEKLSIKKIGAIALAFIGVALTLTNWDINILITMNLNKGDMIMILAVFCWATYSILVKKHVKNYTPLFLTAYSFITCTIILFPFAIAEGLFDAVALASKNAWIAVLYMSIFPTVFGYLIQQKSIGLIGPSKTSIFINLVPVFSIILSITLLDEQFYLLNIFSGLLIILSVYITTIKLKD
ncbi:DMT family transporter [Abyssisolibacter fermentans]|uniref:DMT family transporter n=1 Tax=Abyssisolibacter fermentans TaxID=1766203 RepID=UPI00082CCBC8|nr:DMT family transporter [Abyssisolibacter fermentans]